MDVRAMRWQTLVAVACGVWAAAFLSAEGLAPALVLGGALGAAVFVSRRFPAGAAVVVAAASAAGQLAGVPADSPWDLPAWLTALYVLGRHEHRPLHALAPAVLLWGVTVSSDPTPATALFALVAAAVPWVLGRAVAQRAAEAEQAAARRAELAAVDAEAHALRVAAEERARLAGDLVAVLRRSVEVMRRQALEASSDLAVRSLTEIQEQGRHATTELRRLLGLLRSEEAEEIPPAPIAGQDPHPRASLRRRVIVAVGLVALLAVEATMTVLELGSPVGPAAVAACLLLVFASVLRDRPMVACLVAALTPATALLRDLVLPYGLWSAVVAVLLLWSVAAVRAPAVYAAAGAFAALFLFDVSVHAPDNTAITLVTLLLAAIVGHVWTARARAERQEKEAAAALQAEHAAAAERALRRERLRLARELHDVASHAVGVMVLQAGAAEALRTADPDAAREALDVVRAAADDALVQLDGLDQLLEGGAVGVGGASGAAGAVPHGDVAGALHNLAERMRTAGMQVRLDLSGDLPDEPALGSTVYRIVQEALTNAMRYAPGSPVAVTVTATDVVEVVVQDEGPRRPPSVPATTGFGLVGLAERVTAQGGQFSATSRKPNGFTVQARLPIHHRAGAES